MHLSVADLGFAYPRQPQVLTGVTFEVPGGSSLAIVGPSGTGKTTLLALIGGLLTPDAGTAHVVLDDGERRAVGPLASWVLQTVNVLPDRTVADNVALGSFASGVGRRAALDRVDPALAQVGLSGYGRRPVRTLSGGEVQRVVIARALVSDRPVVLADEPTGQLDPRTTSGVAAALLAAGRDRIVVVVTHDPAVAALCSHVLRLDSGHLEVAA